MVRTPRFSLLFALTTALAMSLWSPAIAAFSIVVDPGHGGTANGRDDDGDGQIDETGENGEIDPGAVGCGLRESDINLDVSLRLRDLLTGAGQNVSLTRTADVFVNLQVRADFANARGADRFASIHSNAFDDAAANGTETFCHTSLGTSADMRDKIHEEMIAAWGLTDRGVKTANFTVLSATSMPATLSELGFVTNCSVDAVLLADSTRRGEAAQAHLDGIARHLGVEPA